METLTVNRKSVPLKDEVSINNLINEELFHPNSSDFTKPTTQYVKSGEINIAYQVFGTGNIDLVYIPGWVSNIDWMWSCPELVNFLQQLGKVARVILFDKRGTGLSDRVVEFSTLEERMEDIQAVMNATGSDKAVLFGHSEGGSVSTLYAATYPHRVISLITFGIFAKRRYSPDYPWAPTDEERQKVYDMIENRWGCEKMGLESLAPSKANDSVFMNWLASYCRYGASPSAALSLTKMNTEVNIVDILGAVKVPTLILQRTNDIDVKIEEGKFIAQRIKGSKFVELTGDDHLFWVGNTKQVLEEMSTFMQDVKPPIKTNDGLITVLSSNIASSTHDNQLYELICNVARKYKGKIIKFENLDFTIIFKGPGMAVNCALQLAKQLKGLQINFSTAIYMKESSLQDYKKNQSKKDCMTKSILSQAYPSQILITQTIKNLLLGTDLNFAKHNVFYDSLINNLCNLYQVTNKSIENEQEVEFCNISHPTTFLESVLQTIEKYLANEIFGIKILSREIGVSERQLQRKIKRMTSKSPNQLITFVRLNKAKELLFLQRFTVAEIAFKTGFSSASYFSKCFKKEFGVSPTSIL